jgi:phage tail-like protein
MAEEFATSGTGLRRTVTIVLLNSLKVPVMTWNISDAFPLKWTGPQLNSGENSVAIQTLEFAGGEVVVAPGAVGS